VPAYLPISIRGVPASPQQERKIPDKKQRYVCIFPPYCNCTQCSRDAPVAFFFSAGKFLAYWNCPRYTQQDVAQSLLSENASTHTLHKIAKALHVPATDLIEDEDIPEDSDSWQARFSVQPSLNPKRQGAGPGNHRETLYDQGRACASASLCGL
jgi:hypothetical protein